MSSGDAFPQNVKDRLARRAGYVCSMPECRAPTSGPSETASSGQTNVAVAAHITAGSPGGPRYDGTLTPEERRSERNGIWLCQTDAKLIDSDESRFTVDLLREWRRHAEARAKQLGERPGSQGTRDLLFHRRSLAGSGAEALHEYTYS